MTSHLVLFVIVALLYTQTSAFSAHTSGFGRNFADNPETTPPPEPSTVYTLTTTIAQQTPGNEYCPECFNAPAFFLSLVGYTGLSDLVLNIFPGEPQVCNGDKDCDGRRLQSSSTVAVVTTTVPASNTPGQSQMNNLGQTATVATVTGMPVTQSTLTSAPAPSGGCSYTCGDYNSADCVSTFQTSYQATGAVIGACNECSSSPTMPTGCRMCCDICCAAPPPPPPPPLLACAHYGFFCGEHGCDCDSSCGTPWDPSTSILQPDNLNPTPYPTDDPEHTQCRNRHFCTCTSDSPTDPAATCTCIQRQNGPPFAPVQCLRNEYIASCRAASPTGVMYKTDCSYTKCP